MKELIVEQQSYFKDSIVFHKGEIFEYLNHGMTRNVFVNKDKTKVVKINKDSFDANTEELEIYEKSNQKDKMAETWKEDGHIIQEYCRPILDSDYKTIGDVKFVNSCRQDCGVNLNGQIVCFDLSEFKKY
jgi:hypothetical protein